MNNLLMVLFFVLPVTVFAEGSPWGRVSSLSVTQDTIGVVLLKGGWLQDPGKPGYYEVNPKTWKMTSLDEKQYKSKFANAPSENSPRPEWGDSPKEFKVSAKDTLTLEYQDCEGKGVPEDGPVCKRPTLSYNGQKFSTQFTCKSGCNVQVAKKWDQQLWIGLATLGEVDWYGRGFQVYDIETKKRKLDQAETVIGGQLASLFVPDTYRNWMWVGTNTGLMIYDRGPKLVRYCHLEVSSEQTGSFKFDCDKK